jgi:hypothetical protein
VESLLRKVLVERSRDPERIIVGCFLVFLLFKLLLTEQALVKF